MANIIPAKEHISRGMGQDNYNGFFDYFYVANSSDLTTWPSIPALDNTVTAANYMTATGSFGTTAAWMKVQVKPNTLKLVSQFPNLAESVAQESLISYELDKNKESDGFINKFSGKDLQVVLPALNGDLIWVGGKDTPAKITKAESSNEIAAAKISGEIKAMPFRPIYLAANTTINTVTYTTVP